jgi:hypothetical protein
MQTYYIINPSRVAGILVIKRSVGAKQCRVGPKFFNKFASDDASLHGHMELTIYVGEAVNTVTMFLDSVCVSLLLSYLFVDGI